MEYKIGLKRNTIDKFYTKTYVAMSCIEFIKKNIKITKNDLCIEPSAGNGSFNEYIKSLTDNYKFYDLEPEHPEIIKQDFLNLDVRDFTEYKNIHIIGNPPFGRQSSLAIQFIKKCCKFAKSISFILPKSFKKNSLKKHFNVYYHLIFEYNIPDNSFLTENKSHNVPCVFQIWEKKT